MPSDRRGGNPDAGEGAETGGSTEQDGAVASRLPELDGLRTGAVVAAVVVAVLGLGLAAFGAGGDPAAPPDASSLTYRMQAVAALNATGQTGLAAKVRNTSAAYADLNHTRSVPFRTDVRVLRATDNATVERALARSDDALASAAVRDVVRARELLERHDTSYDEGRVQRLLAGAIRHLRAGRQARPEHPVRAVREYAAAYADARAALVVMDRAFRPRVRFTDRSDPVGGLGRNRTVYGSVVDVLVTSSQRVTLTVDGATRTVAVGPSAVPVEPVSFGATVPLPGGPTVVTASSGSAGDGPAARLRLDGDGLSDRFERRHDSLDPMTPDSDGDGRLDGRETYTTRKSDDQLGISLSLTGQGNVAGGVSIARAADDRAGVGIEKRRVSPVVQIEAGRSFERARIRISYDDSGVANESGIAVYRYSSKAGAYLRLPSTVFPENDTVVTTTRHFSPHVALSPKDVGGTVGESRDVMDRITARTDVPRRTNLDGFVVHRERGPGGPQLFVYLSDGGRKAFGKLVFEDARATAFRNWESDAVAVQGDGFPSRGATNSFSCSADEVYLDSPGKRVDFNLNTCGAQDGFTIPYEVTGPNPTVRVRFRGATTVDRVKLGGASPSTVPEGSTVALFGMNDTDGDGLPSREERTGMLTGKGVIVETNSTERDTDGDGLSDGREMGRVHFDPTAAYNPYYDPVADPTDGNTDDVGFNDSEELKLGTDPRTPESQVIAAMLPTTMDKSTGRPKTPSTNWVAGATGEHYLLEPAEVAYYGGESKKPGFLRKADYPARTGYTYALVDVPIYVGTNHADQRIRVVRPEFTGKGVRVVSIGRRPGPSDRSPDSWVFGPGELGVGVEEGYNQITLIVRIDEEVTASDPPTFDIQSIGKFRMTVVRDGNSVFSRSHDAASDAFSGTTKVTITSRKPYAVRNLGSSTLRRMHLTSLEKLEGMAITAIGMEIGFTGPAAQAAAGTMIIRGYGLVAQLPVAVQYAKTLCSVAETAKVRRCRFDMDASKGKFKTGTPPASGPPAGIASEGKRFEEVSVTSAKLTDVRWPELTGQNSFTFRSGSLYVRTETLSVEYMYTGVVLARAN